MSFGFTPEQSLLYGTPQGAVIVISLSINATLGARYGQRIFFGALALGVAVMGLIIVVVTPEQYRVARLVWYNFLSAVVCSFVVMVGLIASNIAGYTKKATVAAMYLIGFCVGNMIGEFFLFESKRNLLTKHQLQQGLRCSGHRTPQDTYLRR